MPEAAPARKQSVNDVVAQAIAARTNAAPKTSPQATDAPTNNEVYKIVMDPALSPEEARDAVAAYRQSTGSKEKDRAREQAYRECEEYVQSIREQMARKIISLTDTEAVSELQKAYNDQNEALIAFNGVMRPLTDMLDAVFALRTADKAIEAFQEIKRDRQAEEELEHKKLAIESEFHQKRELIGQIQRTIAERSQEKAFFGIGALFGSDVLKESARKEVARLEVSRSEAERRIGELTQELEGLEKVKPTSNLGDLAKYKGVLRDLLYSKDHDARQKQLVRAAEEFVQSTKERSGAIRRHFDGMDGQIDNLRDANSRLGNVVAVLDDGTKLALDRDKGARAALAQAGAGGESAIARMIHEDKVTALDEHVATLESSAKDSTVASSELATQAIRIKSMRDANRNQMDGARLMHSQGVAGISDRLSVVLNAVSAAALGESAAVVKDTMRAMMDSTNEFAQKEVVKLALGADETNKDILHAIEALETYGQTQRTFTDLSRQSLTELRDSLDKMADLTGQVRDATRDAIAVNATLKDSPPSTTEPPRGNGFFGGQAP